MQQPSTLPAAGGCVWLFEGHCLRDRRAQCSSQAPYPLQVAAFGCLWGNRARCSIQGIATCGVLGCCTRSAAAPYFRGQPWLRRVTMAGLLVTLSPPPPPHVPCFPCLAPHCSTLFAQFEGDTYLLFGLGDGQLVNYRWEGRPGCSNAGQPSVSRAVLPALRHCSRPAVAPLPAKPQLQAVGCGFQQMPSWFSVMGADWKQTGRQTERRLRWAPVPSCCAPSGVLSWLRYAAAPLAGARARRPRPPPPPPTTTTPTPTPFLLTMYLLLGTTPLSHGAGAAAPPQCLLPRTAPRSYTRPTASCSTQTSMKTR
jgi:hypothetical protein